MTVPTSRGEAEAGHSLDVAAAIRVVQSVSREIVPGKLVEKTLRLALEDGGATRGILALSRDGTQLVAGEAESVDGTVSVRTHDDGRMWTLDPVPSGEMLALPLIADGEQLGTLYLEAPASHGFTPDRMAMLELLAAQSAISLRHAQLIATLRQTEGKQQDDELRRLLEIVPQQIFVLRSDMSLEYANQAVVAYHGDALRHVLSDRDVEYRDRTLHHPEDLARIRKERRRAFEEGQPIEVEARLLRGDGEYRWFLIRLNALHDDEGRVIRWYGTRTDIHERKQTEERIRQDERELRMVVDFVPDHLVVHDPTGGIIYANRAALAFTGRTLEETVGHPDVWPEIIHPDDLSTVRATIQGLVEGAGREVEVRLRRRDGQYRWILARQSPLRDDQGRIVRWFSTGVDIEDRKRAEQRMQQENLALREEVDKASMFEEIVGTSRSLRAVLTSVAKVAPTDSTVLVTGETGTGKELVARAIHKRSPRAARAFVSVNCAAIPPTLIASELFGHEKGAFTGALQRRPGRFELADGGTIFLDEIGDLPPDTQLALLRVLQEREFERVGATRPMKVDVRVIAATNRDLQAAMDEGTFRSDLYYRLSVFPIEMPPLRERVSDIPLLVAYFVDRYASQAGKTIRHVEKDTLDLVESYRWPGNVRELQNVVERSVIVCDSDTLAIDPRWLSRDAAPAPARPLADELVARERGIIETALEESRGRVSGPSGAATKLGLPASTLESKIRALGIDKHRFRDDATLSRRR